MFPARRTVHVVNLVARQADTQWSRNKMTYRQRYGAQHKVLPMKALLQAGPSRRWPHGPKSDFLSVAAAPARHGHREYAPPARHLPSTVSVPDADRAGNRDRAGARPRRRASVTPGRPAGGRTRPESGLSSTPVYSRMQQRLTSRRGHIPTLPHHPAIQSVTSAGRNCLAGCAAWHASCACILFSGEPVRGVHFTTD